jgi:nicotinamidase/pyrazinamidase
MKINDTDALIAVDVQNDFCPGGALPVLGGEGVVRVINPLQLKFERLIFTRDWHPQDHCSFALEPEFQDGSWPTHCVEDSPGAEFQGDLHVPSDAIIISKGTDPDKEAYSGFQDTDLETRLKDMGVTRVFVAGLALDYCVKATVLDARNAGIDVVLVRDGCRSVDDADGEAAVAEMKEVGVQVCNGADIHR